MSFLFKDSSSHGGQFTLEGGERRLFGFHQFSTSILVLLQDPIQYTLLTPAVTSRESPLICDSFGFALSFMILPVLWSIGQVFCRLSLSLGLSDIFSWLCSDYRFGRWTPWRWWTFLITSYQGVWYHHDLIPVMQLWSLSWGGVFQISPLWRYYFSFHTLFFSSKSLSPA